MYKENCSYGNVTKYNQIKYNADIIITTWINETGRDHVTKSIQLKIGVQIVKINIEIDEFAFFYSDGIISTTQYFHF